MPEVVTASRRHPVRDDELTFEPSERWVRATIGSTTVVDSRAPVLVWEPGSPVPCYAFPTGDVRMDLLQPVAPAPAGGHVGTADWYDLVVDGRRYDRLAWTWAAPQLAGLVTFDWMGREAPGVEHWYEEDEEIFRHPRDPYKRVDPIPSSRHVVVALGGRVLADTRRPVLLYETRLPTRYYVPAEDVDFSALEPTDLRTRCPYKGVARYWSVRVEPAGRNIVWSYPDPVPAAAAITDLVAFYDEVVDITVDGVPQPRPVSEFSAGLAAP